MENNKLNPQNQIPFEIPCVQVTAPSLIEEKVVKSVFGTPFYNDRVLDTLLEEEKALGWSLVEVIDGANVKFSRSISERGDDLKRYNKGYDPYRTTYGITLKSLVQISFFLLVIASNLTYHLLFYP
jgi:hypothetical protein